MKCSHTHHVKSTIRAHRCDTTNSSQTTAALYESMPYERPKGPNCRRWVWARPAVCAWSSAAHSSASTGRRHGAPAPITTVRREPTAKTENRCNELPAVIPGVGEVLSVHDRAAIDLKRASHPNLSGHRAVALQQKRDARGFCAPGASGVECLSRFTRHGRLLPCARPRGIADRRSDRRSRRPRN